MTNATTGGGNGAAPVGTEGATPAPERLLPTRPGWWWGRVRSFNGVVNDEWEAVRLWDRKIDSGLWCNAFGCWADDDHIEWLAEVPPPAECAAWAANGCPSAAVLGALGTFSAALLDDISGDWKANAWRNLTDAIRAERAAQGSAPAGQGVSDA